MENHEIGRLNRLSNGLIDNIVYVQTADGLIDWRKMVKPEYLVPNRQVFEKQNKPIPESIEGLEDKDLLILLGGIKKLARLRGYTKISYNIVTPHPEYVAMSCEIEWFPNFETDNKIIVTSGTADAHPGNTNSFGRMYLCAIAENRSFVRCVRNFLGIEIVGQDEIGGKLPEEAPSPAQTSPAALLERLMTEKGVTFDTIKAKMVSENVEGATLINCIAEIPKVKTFELIERLRKKKV